MKIITKATKQIFLLVFIMMTGVLAYAQGDTNKLANMNIRTRIQSELYRVQQANPYPMGTVATFGN